MEQFDFSTVKDRRGTYSTQWDYIADRFERADLLPFTISDMDFETAPSIKKALALRVEHGIFGYSRWNNDSFKDAICNWFTRRFNAIIDKDAIAYSPSIIYSVSKLIEYYSDENDGVIVQCPVYDGFLTAIKGLKRRVLFNPLLYDACGAAYIDFAGLEQLAKNASVILLCNPHNPTGRVWTLDELKKIFAIVQRYNLAVISDDAHMDIVYAPFAYIPLTQIWGRYKKAALAASIAKGFNAASLGGSYIIFNDMSQRQRFLNELKTRGLSSANALFISALISAYNEGEKWLAACTAAIHQNLIYINEFLMRHIPVLRMAFPPQGTYFAWLNAAELSLSSQELQERLINKGALAIMSGDVYAETRAPFLRFNAACPSVKIETAMQKMKTAFR